MAGSQGKKSKKAGRSVIACQSYKNSNRRERNKIKRIQKHLKKQPSDVKAEEHIGRLKKLVKGF